MALEEKWWWLSCKKMTFGVQTKDGIIVYGAPIVKKFRGQPLDNLIRWMKKFDGFQITEMKNDKDKN